MYEPQDNGIQINDVTVQSVNDEDIEPLISDSNIDKVEQTSEIKHVLTGYIHYEFSHQNSGSV
jgi:hypothetical protein